MSGNSDSMIEKVARAILGAHDWMASSEDHDGTDKPLTFDDMTPDWKDAYMDMARAAIEAMSEATPEMLRCGDVYVNGYEDMRSVGECWRAMIAAALSEDDPPRVSRS